MADLIFDVAGLTCEVAGLNTEVPDLRPGGTRLNLTPGFELCVLLSREHASYSADASHPPTG